MFSLITTVLAVFAVWEFLSMLLPVDIPAWLQPALVAGFAVGADTLPQRVVTVLAVTGGVALCHATVAGHDAPRLVRMPPRGRLPRL